MQLMSFDSNSSMERLSLVTVIFMREYMCYRSSSAFLTFNPDDIAATFMTGYWGMNIEIERFTSMPYDDLGFWYVGKCEIDPRYSLCLRLGS